MKKKAGVLSCSISIILLGVLLLLKNFKVEIPSIYYDIIGPLFLILLGIEIIFSKTIYGEENNGINIGLVLFTIIVMVISMAFFYFSPFGNSIFRLGGVSFGNLVDFVGPRKTKIVNKEIDVSDGIDSVDIKNKMGSVKFTGTDGNKMIVEATIRYKGGRNDINDNSIILNIDGNTAYLSDNIDRSFYNVDTNLFDKKYKDNFIKRNRDNNGVIIDYDIKIPQNKKITVNNGFGLVEAHDYNGKTNINNQFGNIDLKNLNGDTTVTNKYGEIDVRDIKGFADVSNEFGSININSTNGARVKNKFGNIDITDIIDGSLNVINEFGSISVRGLPKDLSIDLSTKFGTITTDFPVSYKKNSTESSAVGRVGSGKYEVNITNNHGSIDINE